MLRYANRLHLSVHTLSGHRSHTQFIFFLLWNGNVVPPTLPVSVLSEGVQLAHVRKDCSVGLAQGNLGYRGTQQRSDHTLRERERSTNGAVFSSGQRVHPGGLDTYSLSTGYDRVHAVQALLTLGGE